MKYYKRLDECFIDTCNKMGYMAMYPDQYNQSFIDYCLLNKKGYFIDIGCAFGVSTLPVLEAGCQIIACDIDQRHLEILRSKANQKFLNNLKLIQGHLPNTLKFDSFSFDAINLSMVLHFLSGSEIIKSLDLIFQWLKIKGQLYITTSSPYQGTLKNFIPYYEKNVKENIEWPGIIHDIHSHIPNRAKDLPKFNNVFTPEILKNVVEERGFKVKQYSYFSRENLPSDISYDGREYTGIICQKP